MSHLESSGLLYPESITKKNDWNGIRINYKMLGLGLTKYIPLFAYIICVVCFILTIFYKTEIGLYLVTLLIPLQNLMDKLQVFPFGKDIMDIFMLAFLSIIIISKKENSLDDKFVNRAIMLLIFTSYSALWVGSFKFGLPYPISVNDEQFVAWKNFIMLPLLYFVTLNIVENKKQIMILIWIMVIALILMDVNFYQNTKWFTYEHFSEDKRAVGSTFTYLGPNEIAAFYAQITVFLIGFFLCDNVKVRRMLFLIVVVFNFHCLLYLFSRGGYLSAVVGLIFLGVFKKRLLLVFLILLMFSWTVLLPQSVVERIEMTRTDEGLDQSSQSRIEMWSQALRSVALNPLTGIGFDNTQYLGIRSAKGIRKSVHNGYLKVLVEQGFIGLGIFLIVFYTAMKKGWSLFRQSDDLQMKGLGLGFVAMIVANLVGNLTGDKWSYFNAMGYFWILFGLVVKANQISLAEKKDTISVIETRVSTFGQKKDLTTNGHEC
ncbi:MAG: O-antigen ligase family protein [Nitrospirota bacterium]|nr:O-antigen ligase family protein [Nitrospirota bacterium]